MLYLFQAFRIQRQTPAHMPPHTQYIIHMYTYISTYTHTCTHRSTYTHTCTHRYTHLHTHTNTHTVYNSYVHIYIYIHTYLHTQIHTLAHSHKQTCRQAHMHARSHTHRVCFMSYIGDSFSCTLDHYTPKSLYRWFVKQHMYTMHCLYLAETMRSGTGCAALCSRWWCVQGRWCHSCQGLTQ